MATDMNVIVDKIVIDDSGAVAGARGVESAYDRLSAAAGSAAGDIEAGNNALVALSKAAGTAVGEMGRITAASAQLAAATATLASEVFTVERAWMALDVAVAISREGVFGLKRELAETTVETKLFAEEADKASRAWSTLTKAAGAVGVSLSIGGLMQQAQEYQRAQALIQRAAGDSADSVERSLYRIAQASGASFVELSGLTKALDELPGGMQESLGVVEAVSLAMAQMPGDAQSAEAAITQFTQAMQAGKLRGDEFNSMMEQAPALADALAQGLGTTRGELRSMAEAGELSAERVSKALRGMLPTLRDVNQEIERTLSQSVQNVENALTVFAGRVDQRAGGSSVIRASMGDVTQRLESLEAQNAAVAVMERLAVAGGLASDAVMFLADNIGKLIAAWAVWQGTKAVAGIVLFQRALVTGNVAMRGLAGTVATAGPAIQASLQATGMSADRAAASVTRLNAVMNSTFTRGAGAAGLAASFGVNPFSALMLAAQAAAAFWLLWRSRTTALQEATEDLNAAQDALQGTVMETVRPVEELAAAYEAADEAQRQFMATKVEAKFDALNQKAKALAETIKAEFQDPDGLFNEGLFAGVTGVNVATTLREIQTGQRTAAEAVEVWRQAIRGMSPEAQEVFNGVLKNVASVTEELQHVSQESSVAGAQMRYWLGTATAEDLELLGRAADSIADGMRDAASASTEMAGGLQKFIEQAAGAENAAPALRAMVDEMRRLEGIKLTSQALDAFDSGLLDQHQFDATFGAIQQWIDQGDEAFGAPRRGRSRNTVADTLSTLRFQREQLDRPPVEQAVASALRQAGTTEETEAGAQIARLVRETERLTAARGELAEASEAEARVWAYYGRTTDAMDGQINILRLKVAGQEEAAALAEQEAKWVSELGDLYDQLAPGLRERWEEARRLSEEWESQQESMQYLENIGERAFDRIGSAITQAFTQGEGAAINFGSIAQGVLSELMQSFIELAAINPLKNALFGGSAPVLGDIGGIIGGLFGGGVSTGAPVSLAGVQPTFNPSAGAGLSFMPKFGAGGDHSGGLRLVGEYGPEIEATGPSRIWSADQTAKMLGGGGGNVTVNVINNAGAEVSTQQRPDGNGGMQLDVMVDQAVAKKLGTQGSASNKALRANFGATPVLARR